MQHAVIVILETVNVEIITFFRNLDIRARNYFHHFSFVLLRNIFLHSKIVVTLNLLKFNVPNFVYHLI